MHLENTVSGLVVLVGIMMVIVAVETSLLFAVWSKLLALEERIRLLMRNGKKRSKDSIR